LKSRVQVRGGGVITRVGWEEEGEESANRWLGEGGRRIDGKRWLGGGRNDNIM
jgi:hypothetical protein